jgi:hypothetical protein
MGSENKVAVARKFAVILHRMWIDGSEFNWSKKEVDVTSMTRSQGSRSQREKTSLPGRWRW